MQRKINATQFDAIENAVGQYVNDYGNAGTSAHKRRLATAIYTIMNDMPEAIPSEYMNCAKDVIFHKNLVEDEAPEFEGVDISNEPDFTAFWVMEEDGSITVLDNPYEIPEGAYYPMVEKSEDETESEEEVNIDLTPLTKEKLGELLSKFDIAYNSSYNKQDMIDELLAKVSGSDLAEAIKEL